MRKTWFALLTQLFLTYQSSAQFPIMLKDINDGASSNPNQFIEYNGKTYFTATDPIVGTEIFVTDGTKEGTALLADIYPNSTSSFPNNFIVYKGLLYFTATSPVGGNELWSTDGSGAGTQVVVDINPGLSSSNISNIKILNNQLLFNATTSSNGNELWTSDGTALGTFLLKDIFLGANSSQPSNFYLFKNKLFFVANNGTTGPELWSTDGSALGTKLIKDIRIGSLQSNITSFFAHNNTLYFSANDGINGQELWQTDSSTAGTVMLKNIDGGAGNSNPGNFITFKNTLFFTATTPFTGLELWVSDGTALGTKLHKDLRPGFVSSNANNFFVYNNQLFFNANDSALGNELWISDSTWTGTKLFRDINQGFASSSPNSFLIYQGYLYFFANTLAGTELFKLNPSFDTLSQIMPIGNSPLNPFHSCNTLRLCNQSLYYNGNYTAEGSEPYILNFSPRLFIGTPSNTFYAYIDSLSPIQSIYLNGFSLLDSIRVEMPSNYEFALTSNGPFSKSAVISANTDKTIAQFAYVRFKPNYAGVNINKIIFTCAGLDTINIAVSGYGISIPTVLLANNILDTFKTFVDSTSDRQSFSLSAKKLNDHIILKSKGNFAISKDTLLGYSDSIIVFKTQDSIDKTNIYIRYYPKTKGYEEGSVEINSFGLSAINFTLKGQAKVKPFFAINLMPLDTFRSIVLQHSIPQYFEIYGDEIDPFVEIKANNSFELSNDSNDYASSIKIFPTGKLLNKSKVYIRYAPQLIGIYPGEIEIHSANINTQKIQTIGKSVKAPPSAIESAINQLHIFPNPFSDKIQLESNFIENSTIQIVNMHDQVVFQKTDLRSNQILELDFLPSGIYFLNIESKDFGHSIKLIKN